ncbi:MAG: 50S ribosomal protein L18 [Planctomycetota bacterium]
MDKNKRLDGQRLRRRRHVRNTLRGNSTRPRLSVSRSLKHFSVQLIDDAAGKTVAAASTKDKALGVTSGGNCDAAAAVGKAIAEKAVAAGITQVALDRGHNQYHGRVKAFADAARDAGLTL